MERIVSFRAWSLACTLLCLALCPRAVQAQVSLPGTQPHEGNIQLDSPAQCAKCHSRTASGPNDPYASWQGGMMSLAARDPVFRAALTIANQDIPGVGEFCLRCHTPAAFLAGRALPADGSALTSDDLDGVTCAACHRLVDPGAPEAAWLAKRTPPGLGNAMMVVDPSYTVRGPYGDSTPVSMRPHGVRKSPFLASGRVCGVCHNVSNPLHAEDVNTQPPHAFGHIERTFSEWALSEFAQRGPAGSCQSCHYPALREGGYPTNVRSNPKREYFVQHGPVGGSTWVQDAAWKIWQGEGMDRYALTRGQQRAREFLRTAATLELTFPEPGQARLRITNQTGHKLPTGYPEGRRMWVNARFYDAAGELLREIGRYGEKDDVVLGQPVKLPTLLDPEQTRVYECLPAISAAQAEKYGKPAGPSFFFILNDVIAKDNRIPPKGFKNEEFAQHQCAPRGATYADGQHWDDVPLELPDGTARVEVRLMYQSVSAEYVKFFTKADKTSEWGKKVYAAWNETGRCPPEVMAEISREVQAAATRPDAEQEGHAD